MKNVLTMAKMMCMCFEWGTYARKENRRTTCVHQKRRHHVGAAGTIESRTNVDEIGFHAGWAGLPRPTSAAMVKRRWLTLPRMHRIATCVAGIAPGMTS